ncbi:MAG: phage baseplate assembly protein [Plesiomonas sp.]|uniref:phage baseplate assembly protein n=1 Tax=Plesiomonas sp. TaxID=2486279 RepID=UPI003F2CF623
MNDDVLLRINGRDWGGWEDISISAGIERVARDFNVSITRAWPGAKDITELLPLVKQGDLVEVFMGADKVLTGYVDAMPTRYDARSVSIGITGRSKTADLVDCSADVKQFSRQTPAQILAALAKPFSLSVISQSTLSVISDFSVDFGETVMESIDRVLGLQQVLAFDDANGNLVLGKVGQIQATTALVHGENILTGDSTADFKERFSDYTVSGQRAGNDDDFGESTTSKISAGYRDKNVGRYRPMIIKQSGHATTKTCQELCRFEAVRRAAKSREVMYSVVSWRQGDGQLWQPNQQVIVYDPINGFNNDSLVIAEVEYSKSRDSGTLCRLRVGPSEAYLPEPPDPQESKKRKKTDNDDFEDF